MSCELDKFRESFYETAGVNRTSAVKMNDDIIFLPVGGKWNNEELNSPRKTYEWGKYIKNKINTLYGNLKGFYGDLVTLSNTSSTSPKQGTYVQLNFTEQLQKAIAYKNKELDEQGYRDYLEYQKELEDNEKFEAEAQIIDDMIRSGKVSPICGI